jgi:hypothetical protein
MLNLAGSHIPEHGGNEEGEDHQHHDEAGVDLQIEVVARKVAQHRAMPEGGRALCHGGAGGQASAKDAHAAHASS